MTGPLAERLLIEALPGPPVAARRVELVERKGLGHPDTICDSAAEAVARALHRLYLDRLAAIPHYNIDKALLVAGECRKGFGWGKSDRPMELVLGDRATFEVGGARLPVEETVRGAVEGWLREHLPRIRPERHLRLRIALAPGSAELRGIFDAADRPVGANDSAGAAGYAPLSPTEVLVLDVERFLNGPEFKTAFPDTEEDVKVFALRRDDQVALTVAMPLDCRATGSEAAYFARKAAVQAALAQRFRAAPFRLDWALNALDRRDAGPDGTYLTLTGTSAEDADSGQVGRGNRANGLIAFARPSSAEAAPGKNPVAHPGKLYSVLSHRLAERIHAGCPGLLEVYAHLAVRIGEPVDRPWTGVQVVPAAGTSVGDVEPAIRAIVEAELGRLGDLRRALVRGEIPVC